MGGGVIPPLAAHVCEIISGIRRLCFVAQYIPLKVKYTRLRFHALFVEGDLSCVVNAGNFEQLHLRL
jgi:hypothetical protein